MSENPREQIGGNFPPIADRLQADYRTMIASVDELALEADNSPKEILSDEQLSFIGQIVVRARAQAKKLDQTRADENAPFLASQRAVNGFFNPAIDRLDRIMKALNLRGKVYQDAKAEAERKRAREEADRQRREQAERDRKAAEEAAEHRRQAEAKVQAAEAEAARGRAKAAAAREAEAEELRRKADAVADAAAQESKHAGAAVAFTQEAGEQDARAAVKVRGDTGTLATQVKNWEGTIEDWDAIDLNQIKPHFSRDAVEKAIRGYVRANRDTKPLAGVAIRSVAKTQFR